MKKKSKIYVAGHTGLVGSAIKRTLERKGYNNIIFKSIDELDLTIQQNVNDFFLKEKPEYVFLAAALVGGIIANNTYRADFIYKNIMIQSNVINASWKNNVKKLLFLGSTCVYPKNAPQPLKEEYLLSSPLEYTNEPYAIAKIAGLKMCEAFNIQYNTDFISVMPTNLYGTGDNFNLERSHVLPALLRKIHLGKCLEEGDWEAIRRDFNRYPVDSINGDSDLKTILEKLNKYGVKLSDENYLSIDKDKIPWSGKVDVSIWGTGTPLREFMYSDDMAEACVFVMENVSIKDIVSLNQKVDEPDCNTPHFINIGTQEEISIKELAYKIKSIVGFNGEIVFDSSKPDGAMRKTTEISVLKKLGYKHKYNLENGLKEFYGNYTGL